MFEEGDPIHGELHSSDSSAGVVLVIYRRGSQTAYTLGPHEYIEVHSVEVISAAGGDTLVYFSPDGSVIAGGVIVRGTLAANSGIVMSHMKSSGLAGQNVYLKSPFGVADANFSGIIKTFETDGVRPAWQQSLVPGQ